MAKEKSCVNDDILQYIIDNFDMKLPINYNGEIYIFYLNSVSIVLRWFMGVLTVEVDGLEMKAKDSLMETLRLVVINGYALQHASKNLDKLKNIKDKFGLNKPEA